MVSDVISFAGQTLITIYHKGFDSEIGKRNLKVVEKVGRYNLLFEEKIVPDGKAVITPGWAWKSEGLIDNNNEKNPYSDLTCAYMQEYVYLKKPDRIFGIKDEAYSLKISIEELQQINEFVKKYTGLQIEKNPMCYGNIFVYDSYEMSYRAKKAKGIVINEVFADTFIVVRFKNGETVVSTKMITVTQYIKDLEILSDKRWDSHDIEVYKNGELIYIAKDISYMRRMHLNMHIGGPGKRIKLVKLASEFVAENKGAWETATVGDKADELEELEELYTKINSSFARRIKKDDDNSITFINPSEIDKAMKIITDVLQSKYEEMWIFDAYFSDRNKIAYTLDWMRIISNSSAESQNINIAFYCKNKESAYEVKELIQLIEQDPEIREVLKRKKSLGVSLYQTKSPIHDRFIITRHESQYSGIAIGTSLNSLGENHYCIYKLNHTIACNIWNDLNMWLDAGKIEDSREV